MVSWIALVGKACVTSSRRKKVFFLGVHDLTKRQSRAHLFLLSSDCKSFSWPPVEFYPQDAPLFLYSDNLITVQDIKKRGLTLHPTPRIALFVDSLHRWSLFFTPSKGLGEITRTHAHFPRARSVRKMRGEYEENAWRIRVLSAYFQPILNELRN